MNRDKTFLIFLSILNTGVFYLGNKFATWLLFISLSWKTNFVVQSLWGIIILILITFPVVLLSLLQVSLIKSFESKKYYFKISSYALYIIFAYSIFQPQQNIGLIIMSFVFIASFQFSTAFAESRLRNNTDNSKTKETEGEKNKINDKTESLDYVLLKPYIIAAYRNYLQNNFENTIGYCDKILNIDNNNLQALILRANSLSNLDYKIDAIEDYSRIIDNTDDNSNFYGLLGLAYHDIGEISKGTEFIKIAVEKGQKQYVNYIQMTEMMSDFVKDEIKYEKIKKRNGITFSVDEPLDIQEEINKLKTLLNNELEKNPENVLYKTTLDSIKKNDDFIKSINMLFNK